MFVTEVHLTKKSYNQINVMPRCSDFPITTTYFTTYYNLELYPFYAFFGFYSCVILFINSLII